MTACAQQAVAPHSERKLCVSHLWRFAFYTGWKKNCLVPRFWKCVLFCAFTMWEYLCKIRLGFFCACRLVLCLSVCRAFLRFVWMKCFLAVLICWSPKCIIWLVKHTLLSYCLSVSKIIRVGGYLWRKQKLGRCDLVLETLQTIGFPFLWCFWNFLYIKWITHICDT